MRNTITYPTGNATAFLLILIIFLVLEIVGRYAHFTGFLERPSEKQSETGNYCEGVTEKDGTPAESYGQDGTERRPALTVYGGIWHGAFVVDNYVVRSEYASCSECCYMTGDTKARL